MLLVIRNLCCYESCHFWMALWRNNCACTLLRVPQLHLLVAFLYQLSARNMHLKPENGLWSGNLRLMQLTCVFLLRCQGSLLDIAKHTSLDYFLSVLKCTCHCLGSIAIFVCLAKSILCASYYQDMCALFCFF